MTHIADFWASRAVINYTTGYFDIASGLLLLFLAVLLKSRPRQSVESAEWKISNTLDIHIHNHHHSQPVICPTARHVSPLRKVFRA